ncbi:hypothetical protein HYD45_00925 [Mycoplasmopsis bovis]|nr:hypothetical protein [Mycoplasmopsis bovis]QQH78375.1 hypothetical protein HYD45_00925 [Mycoplasmopsis bovis]
MKINFNAIANSYEDELDKLAYVELIKKTIENMTYLQKLMKISLGQFIKRWLK